MKLNTQIYDEASAWFLECRAEDLDEAGRREFDQWLRKSPEHLSAYLEIAAIWSEGPSLDPTQKWDAYTLIAEARKDPDNVVPLSTTTAEPQPNLPRRRHFALAASLAALAVIGGVWAWLALSSGEYTTMIGEQRSIALADGSTVSMNSKSRIRVRYSKTDRAVDLFEGQALFHVAKDHDRPFIVSASGTQVRAVGTQFDVYERQAGTVVTVLEGEVAVSAPVKSAAQRSIAGTAAAPHDTAAPPISVAAGEQLTVTAKAVRKSAHVNVASATAWTERRIVFESATLSEVAEEFNRYNERQLVIDDPGLYNFHISAVFSSTDPDSLIRFLRERPDVKVTEQGTEIRISKNI